ncbi:MAG: DUF6287 domain-containing protein [Rothia sp. (in: high G+C Gram-positive bacteria)]|uniref:DUF6287 domain-containing protein n=1 Tax=Rothia sp. (in: high G+C Gram-positive bacteria) TaxID=1885016 RepID=UPI0026E10CA4|nr:DUF6287 domain-containing protein [Rothia sp. (in: high G+C Gram-positive bacteria)]MDO5750884.1 DUF6287 domain-containing protein [Rothia sp. (in: high G+C Gram-positive bacteria)]
MPHHARIYPALTLGFTALLTLSSCSIPGTESSQSSSPSASASSSASTSSAHSSTLDAIARGDFTALTGTWASSSQKLAVVQGGMEWSNNDALFAKLSQLSLLPEDKSVTYDKFSKKVQDGALILSWESSAHSDKSAYIMVYPEGVALKNPFTGAKVESNESTLRVVALTSRADDLSPHMMTRVSTEAPQINVPAITAPAPSSTASASTSSYSPSPSGAAESTNNATRPSPSSAAPSSAQAASSSGMNTSQIARGDYSSIQGSWLAPTRKLYVTDNHISWTAKSAPYAEINGLSITAIQDAGTSYNAPTVRWDRGALLIHWKQTSGPNATQLMFYPAGVEIYDQNTGAVIPSDTSRDRILSGAPEVDRASEAIMVRS